MANDVKFNPPGRENLADVETARSVAYTSDVIEIEGVIRQGQSGSYGKYNNKKYDVHLFGFIAWRQPGKAVVERELTLLRAVEPGSDYFSEFSELSIYRFEVLLSVNQKRAIVWRKSESEADKRQLSEIAQEFAKPVITNTKKFGKMTLDRRINMMEGNIMWNGNSVRLYIEMDGTEGIKTGLKIAETLYENQASWSKKVNDYAVENLLPGWNDEWKVDDGPDMTAEQFISKITLTGISIDRSGEFTFDHDDGDIFAGHYIVVGGTLETGLNNVDTPG